MDKAVLCRQGFTVYQLTPLVNQKGLCPDNLNIQTPRGTEGIGASVV